MLITPEYKLLNAELHKSKPAYGSKGGKEWPKIQEICQKAGYKTVLDYGCGKNGIKHSLKGVTVYQYDPGLDIDERQPCDLVYCRDVLEHIEPECLNAVLDDIRRLTLKRAWFLIATTLSGDILPDGTNAHRIVESIQWWMFKLHAHGLEALPGTKESRKAGCIQCEPI